MIHSCACDETQLLFNSKVMPRFWLNLQSEYDMRMATRALKDKIAPRIRVFQAAA